VLFRSKVTLIGRVGSSPEIKDANGRAVCNMNIATWESYKDGDEWKQITEWHNVVIWGDATKSLEKIKKGDMVVVDGKIRTKSWEKDGVTHYKTEIVGTVKAIPHKKDSSERESVSNDSRAAFSDNRTAEIFPPRVDDGDLPDF
jgi:single-strand DNA-binding protein